MHYTSVSVLSFRLRTPLEEKESLRKPKTPPMNRGYASEAGRPAGLWGGQSIRQGPDRQRRGLRWSLSGFDGSIYMAGSTAKNNGHDCTRILGTTQRLYGRIDDLPELLDLMAQSMIELLEDVAPQHAGAPHILSAAGLLSRNGNGNGGVFRPLRLKGRPDPGELRSFVEHVGPGDAHNPTGLMGWCVARRMVGLRQGSEWFVAERDDVGDRWSAPRPASPGETLEMSAAAISAYSSLRSQLAVPILDPEIRGQARPRDAFGVLNIESDELLTPHFCDLMIGFSNAVGYPLRAAVRLRDLVRFSRCLTAPMSRATLAAALLDATLPYLPGTGRHGLVALRSTRGQDRCIVEAMTTDGLSEELVTRYRAGTLDLVEAGGAWAEAVRTARSLYVPDLPRVAREQHRPLWEDSRSMLILPLVSGPGSDVLGLLGLESPETSYAFSMQDKGFFEMQASFAAVAAASIAEARLEYPEAVRVPALLRRLKKESLAEVPEDQIVRINVICRALVKHNFAFPRAAEESRLTVHILREYTSRAPRIVDVEALRSAAARRQEVVRPADPSHGVGY